MPAGKLMTIGVWDDGRFAGAIVFGRGASPKLHLQFALTQHQVIELVRVALRADHSFPVSRALSVALRMLVLAAPGLRIVVSFADTLQGHHGGIYQATNWIYVGTRVARHHIIHGRQIHFRSVSARYGTAAIPWLRANIDPAASMTPYLVKHKYLYPLSPDIRKQLAPLGQPYPKRL